MECVLSTRCSPPWGSPCLTLFHCTKQDVANRKTKAIEIELDDLANVGHSVHIGGLMRLDIEELFVDSVYVTVWASLLIPLHMGRTENASTMVDEHFGRQLQYKDLDGEFLRRIAENTRRYIAILTSAVDELMPEPTEAFPDDDHDILMTQRSEEGTENTDGSDPKQHMPSFYFLLSFDLYLFKTF